MIISVGGIFYCRKTKRFLFLLRAAKKHNSTWAFPGGKVDHDETVIDGLYREISEELGKKYWETYVEKQIPLEKFTSDDGTFEYHTYVLTTHSEFSPMLNHEHSGYCWVDFAGWRGLKLHPGVFSTLRETVIKKKLMK